MSTQTLERSVTAKTAINHNLGLNQPKKQRFGAFAQLGLVQPHHLESGEVVKKAVSVTFPMPVGAEHLGEEVITQTLSPLADLSRRGVERFNSQDTLLAASATTDQMAVDQRLLVLYGRLIDAAEGVVLNHIDELLDKDSVREFLVYNQRRRVNLARLTSKAGSLLANPEYQRTSAWDCDYDGIFLLEHFIKPDGKMVSLDAKGEEMEINSKLAVGTYGHDRWLDRFPQMANSSNDAVLVFGHYDGTPTVANCRSAAEERSTKVCADFFESKMEVIGDKTEVLTSAGLPVLANVGSSSESHNPQVECSSCKSVNSSEAEKCAHCEAQLKAPKN